MHLRNSAQSISVGASCPDITHSSMSKLWGPVPLSMAPLYRGHLRDNRNAHPLQLSLPPSADQGLDGLLEAWWLCLEKQQKVNIAERGQKKKQFEEEQRGEDGAIERQWQDVSL